MDLTKYRHPVISEFVDGFTYEVYSEGHDDGVESFSGWYEYTVGIDCWRDDSGCYEAELSRNNIRVKISLHPESFEITTIDDFAKVVTEDNLLSIMSDFTNTMLAYAKVKAKHPDTKVKSFTWINDGKSNITLEVSERMTEESIKADLIKDGYIDQDLRPLKCIKCDRSNLKNVTTDTLDGHTILEYDSVCTDCEMVNGSWAHGNWQIQF